MKGICQTDPSNVINNNDSFCPNIAAIFDSSLNEESIKMKRKVRLTKCYTSVIHDVPMNDGNGSEG